MSEAEKSRRLDYRKIRKKWISLQAAILAVILVVALISTVVYFQLDKTHYINYTEQSTVDYGVYLKENEFYDTDYLGKDQAYVASLIEKVVADFEYELRLGSSQKVDYEYSYRVDAVLEVMDKDASAAVFAPKYEIIPTRSFARTGSGLIIHEQVELDYAQYNELASRFVSTYNLTNTDCNLVLQMHVSVVGACDEFSNSTENNEYVVALTIPLTTKTVHVEMTSSIPTEENKILACNNSVAKLVFRVLSIVFLCVGALLTIEIVAFVYLTRNTDITYEIKVSRLVKTYKSFIQKITNVFDTTGYQVLCVDTFQEMLEIRDTIQSPILMNENVDKTSTKFLIPTNTKILYQFEIRVDDYDEIYGLNEPEPDPVAVVTDEEPETDTLATVEPAPAAPVERVIEQPVIKIVEKPIVVTVERPVVEFVDKPITVEAERPVVEIKETVSEEPIAAEESVIEEPIAEEPVQMPVEEPESVAVAAPVEEVAESADGEEEGGSGYSNIRRSFMAKLIQSTVERKAYYSELKNELLSYRGVKSRISWHAESYNKGRTHLAKLAIRGKTLCLCLALNPADFAESKYFYTDVSEKNQYQTVPMMLKIKSGRGVKHAKELIALLADQKELVRMDSYESVDYAPPHQTTQELIALGLIKDPNGEYAVRPVSEDVELLEPITAEELTEALNTPDAVIEEIDYVDTPVADEVEDGVEVVEVVWKEQETANELHSYDPNGAVLTHGDVVLVPTQNAEQNTEVIRKAAVAHSNHRVDPESVESPLKKIIGVLKRKMQDAINSNIDS